MKNFSKALLAYALAVSAVMQASATDYVCHKSVPATDGEWFGYMEHDFVTGVTAFNSVWSVLAKIQDGDNIYFGPGAVGDITISKNNITLFGANAWCDAWSGQRNQPESSFTGTVKIAKGVSGLTINGFTFSGNGCVRNDDAGRGSTSVSDFSFVYNKVENTTLERGDKTAVVYLGDAWRPANTEHPDPSVWAANARYVNVTVAHNAFIGKNAANQPAFVHIAGSAGTTAVVDNRFDLGGASVSLFNTCGDVRVEHNRFTDVGKGLLASGTATGEFCLRLFYVGARSVEPADMSICHNVFDGCQGQSSMFALIRFFSGDSNEAKFPPYAAIRVNHNDFRNKTSYRQSDGHNYVFYANRDVTTEHATVDWRFNHYDQSELEFAWIRPAWQTAAGRFFAGSSEMFDNSTSDSQTEGTGTLIDFYGATTDNIKFGVAPADGTPIHNWVFKSTTVVQSSDRDDVTNDWYFMQVMSAKYKGTFASGTFLSDSPIVVTRHYKNGSSWAESVMNLDRAGHGSNMAVINVDGQPYLVMGGYSPAGSSSSPTKVCIVPYVDGATVNVAIPSFTYGGKTYTIRYLDNPCPGETNVYPSLDRDNNLLVVRTRKSGTHNTFTVFDLAEVLESPAAAKPLKKVVVPCYTNAITNSSRAFLNRNDRGFTTWSDQGFTISGDYIYAYEGNGNEGYNGTPDPRDTSIGGDSKPIQIINTINWRTGRYVSRKAILKTKVYADAAGTNNKLGPFSMRSGEPESIKIHRDASGHPNLIIGIVDGSAGARQYNLYAYRQKRVNGQGYVFNNDCPERTVTPSAPSLSLSTSGAAVSTSLSTTVSADVRDVTATVVGADGAYFSVARKSGTVLGGNHTYTVGFAPDTHKKTYSAYLRLSSPGATDVLVPLYGTYSGTVSGITSPIADTLSPADIRAAVRAGAALYDLSGLRVCPDAVTSPLPLILCMPDGTARKVMYP